MASSASSISSQACDVAYWHKADIQRLAVNVRFQVNSEHPIDGGTDRHREARARGSAGVIDILPVPVKFW